MSQAGASATDSHCPDFDPPRRTGTDSSHYSCSNLPDDDPARYIKASEARRQADEALAKRARLPTASGNRTKLSEYPKTYRNDEKLDLEAKSPWREYPVFSSGKWDPSSGASGAGAARIIYNNGDRDSFNVVYHDPKMSDKNYKNFSVAPYRKAK
ncbi:hypothetical protein QBC47DRAFT_362067 [Echria macrotheca]|uniref:Uncharacterized protein n=1 Tax=Echria macrotheca TaxID=438768 RepID=A0AAJ0BDW9_9PEZI|nr:hypothetical protein QBC47DRAFT_362067 [Echria macrotheca]